MSDEELIAQLRNSKGWPTLGNAAADRIEALTDQLAKAVEALREIADAFGCECGDAARATWAEIEGEKP
jgi:hypothetical protein